MITEERFTDYINSLDTGNNKLLESIRSQALKEHIPIIRQETEALLKTLVRIRQPKTILEVGTAVGYSALIMSEHMPENCSITTIEKYGKRIPQAKEHFKKAGMDKRITLLEGDALEILEKLEGEYDFIFMDAAKAQYIHFLPYVMRLMPVGGVLVSDNVLQDGDIIESRFAVVRRNRTIYARMREYLYALTHSDELQTSVVPIGDGVTISTRIKEKTERMETCATLNY